MIESSPCRSCGAPVLWAKSAVSGKALPLDAVTTETAPGALMLTADGTAHSFARVPEDERGDGTWHLSHFATCPQANHWRKRKVGIT